MSSIPSPSTIRALQAAAILGAAGAAGANSALSVFVVPRLLESPPDVMLRQWQRTFAAGKHMFIPTSLLVALTQLGVFLAQRKAAGGAAVSRLPLLVAGLTVAIMPYTVAFMLPTNRALLARADKTAAAAAATGSEKEGEKTKEEVTFTTEEIASSRKLVDYWGLLNLGRSMLLAAAAGVGMATL